MGSSLLEFIESIFKSLEVSARRLVEFTSRVCAGVLTGLMVKFFVGVALVGVVLIAFAWLLFRARRLVGLTLAGLGGDVYLGSLRIAFCMCGQHDESMSAHKAQHEMQRRGLFRQRRLRHYGNHRRTDRPATPSSTRRSSHEQAVSHRES